MRLVGQLHAKDAFIFHNFLLHEGIENLSERSSEEGLVSIWIQNEDDFEKAESFFGEFQSHTTDPKFQVDAPLPKPAEPSDSYPDTKEELPPNMEKAPSKKLQFHPITKFMIALCCFIFLFNLYQVSTSKENTAAVKLFRMSKMETSMLYDYPIGFQKALKSLDNMGINYSGKVGEKEKQALDVLEKAPYWRGLYEVAITYPDDKSALEQPLFEKIMQGEIWRVYTPALLHGGFLHILFNMLWLFLLGKQVEERVGAVRYIFMMILFAIVSSTCQYLMSGFLFMGYSGVIAGLAGFIWMRQKIAPWEGYPLQKGTIIFLVIFILAMLALQIVSFILIRFKIADFPISIANAAHISGALIGVLCARIPIFSREVT